MPRKKKQYIAHVGALEIDVSTLARNTHEIENRLVEVIENDCAAERLHEFGTRLFPLAEAEDIAEWDKTVLNVYSPLYSGSSSQCVDCELGPCQLSARLGKCGMGINVFRARLSLREACRGCLGQMRISRELLDYAVRLYGKGKSVNPGNRHTIDDWAPSIGILTGLYVKNLKDLDQALSYAESQLVKLIEASYRVTENTDEIEGMTFHAGSLIFLAMEVAELIKTSCFGFQTSSDEKLEVLNNWPPVDVLGGLGNIDDSKLVIAFLGDDFLPARSVVDHLKQSKLTDEIEICGLGPVGHDIVRFYNKCRIVATTVNAAKAIRTGFADLIVANAGCIPVDVLGEADRVDTRVIWTGSQGIGGLKDRTDDPIDDVIKDLIHAPCGVWVRDVDKAGEIAVKAIQGIKRKSAYGFSESEARDEAKKCRQDCDQCFNVCPNSLLIGKAVREIGEKGLLALKSVEQGCYFCGKCEEICPENIQLRDLIAKSLMDRKNEDKFKMRSGRGSVPRLETAAGAWGVWGISPGFVEILGCGGSKYQEDIGWIAHELATAACYVLVAGCGAAEIARHYEESHDQHIFEEFTSEFQAKNIVYCGACSASCYLKDVFYHYARTGPHVSHYANFPEVADVMLCRMSQVVILWGMLPERMYSMAAGFARNGDAVIVGPYSSFKWKRFLMGDRHDRDKWQAWDVNDGEQLELDPYREHLIIPVETKEEAVVMTYRLLNSMLAIWDNRRTVLEEYIGCHDKFFGELPDDWHLLVRTHMDLPLKKKMILLNQLRDKHGWEIERMDVKRAKHRDGRMLTMNEFKDQYGCATGRFLTKLPRMMRKSVREKTEMNEA